MNRMTLLNAAEQVAAYLRAELISGKWTGTMPGVLRLEAKLGVNRNTLEAGLKLLEEEGLLVSQGPGRRRRITIPANMKHPSLRIAILVGQAPERKESNLVEIQHELLKAGHTCFHNPDTMGVQTTDVTRITRIVSKSEADAWLVLSGSLEVLDWFSKNQKPVFALFGRRRSLSIAGGGPNKPLAYAEATKALIQLGHRRIVLLARTRRRLPAPGLSEQAFLDEMEKHGIPSGPYNLPDWVETIAGFHERLESLFQISPPTALIIDEAPLFVATQQFLARRGIRVPEDVSLVCTDASPDFEWCQQAISHIRWDTKPVVRRAVQWAENVSRGKKDIKQTESSAEFVDGGTIGPVNR